MAEPTQRIERRLAAIFAADVAGYSRLMNQDEVGTLRTLTAHREIMDGLIAKHGGRIANTAGDSVLAEFPSVVDAVQCAVAVQQKLGDANAGLPDERRLQFRIGIHVGDVMVQGRDLLGDGVNIAARVQALAEPGGVWISGKAHDEIEGKLPHLFEEKGEQEVKGIARPIRVYALADVGSTGKPKQVKALPLPDKPSIAVLPFANLSGDPGQDYFADGIVEGVITGLCRTPWLFVIARNSSFTYKGRAVDVKQVGRELGVRYVLEGSLQRSANRVRINAQLVDAGTGAHLAAERFDGTLNDVFDLMDEVAAAVIGAIAPRLERAEIDRARRKPTESLDAYDLYLRGMAAFYRWNRESHEEALRLFVAAIDIAPDFAAAYGMAALCRSISVARGWMTDLDRAVAEGTRWAGQAVRFGQDDADTLAMAGHAISRLAGDLETGADLSERAVALNPNLAQAWLWGDGSRSGAVRPTRPSATSRARCG
jgi:TolB-like protein/class 3 adenylate cyclase